VKRGTGATRPGGSVWGYEVDSVSVRESTHGGASALNLRTMKRKPDHWRRNRLITLVVARSTAA